MKFFSSLVFSCFLGTISFAQDSVSVLFIGNSYTYVNTMPVILADLASSLGDVVYHDSQTPGGMTFAGHAASATTYTKINNQPWDFVVLQAQSQEPSFSDSQVNSETLPYAIQLADSVYANNFCSEVLFFMTWGRQNGDPQWLPISTFDGMNSRLRSAYMRFADSVQGAVSPVGSAWKYVRDNHPTINLYSGDGSHPSYEGSYLAACTFYASVFRKNPVGAPFIGTLNPAVAQILQNAASLTVLDSLEQWNLRPITEHTQADFTSMINGNSVDFTNLSTKATNYIWDFGDGMSSTDENPSHTYASDGTYTVVLIAESPCDADTVSFEFVIGNAGMNDLEGNITMATLGNGHYTFLHLDEVKRITVVDLSGKEQFASIKLGEEVSINLEHLTAGTYIINIETDSLTHSIKVIR